jgi:hypothetical protein
VAARPSSFTCGDCPEIAAHPDRIVFGVMFPDGQPDPDSLRRKIDERVRRLTGTAAMIRQDVERHNAEAPAKVKARLAVKLAKVKAAIGAIEALGIPLKPRNAPGLHAVPLHRKKIELAPRPPSPTG